MTPRRSSLQGLRNLLVACQDQRVALYGDQYSTKKSFFRCNREVRAGMGRVLLRGGFGWGWVRFVICCSCWHRQDGLA